MNSTRAARLSFILLAALLPLAAAPATAQDTDKAPEAEVKDASKSDAEAVADEEKDRDKEAKAGAQDERLLGLTSTHNAVTGLYHLTSAQTTDDLTFRIAIFSQIFSGSDVVRANDEDTRFIGTLGLSVTPLPWLEPYLVLSARSNSNTFSNPGTILAQGDTTLGSKAVYGVAPAFHVGGELRLNFLTGAGETAFNFNATSARIAALGTFDATELPEPLPLRAHLNLGYLIDNSDQLLPEDDGGRKIPPDRVERFAQGLSAYDQVQLGIGAEVLLPYVNLHAEYNLGLLAGQEPAALCGEDQPLPCPSEAGFGANPQTITLGVKGQPIEGLILNGGLDVALTTKDTSGYPVSAPWNLLLGVTYVFDPRPKIVEVERVVTRTEVVEKKPRVGVITGTVVDLDTADGVAGATVTYMNMGLTRQTTDSKDGAFRSYELEPGTTIEVQIEHPDYEPQIVKQKVEEGDNLLQVKLKPQGATAVVSGSVKTPEGGPASGTVLLTGPRTYTVNLTDGRFDQKVLVGAYTLATTVSGYLTAGRDVEVKPNGNAEINLTLANRPAAAVVTVTDSKLLVEGKIEFDKGALKPEAKAILDQVAASILEHPEFKRIRIEAHSDDSGPANKRVEATEAQARAVQDYLVQKGISAERLEARGFGSDQPLVPNISARNKEINRRVSFTVVSRRAQPNAP